ncbi:MAG: DUF1284 domain-containing protein [Sarcina sp.]
MRLRPHHLLCTQAYEGKGYSKEFIKNMDENIKILRNSRGYKVKIQASLDELCVGCPHNNGQVCGTQEKVMNMDKKVLRYFDIKEGIYEYDFLIEKIQNKINKDIFKDICGECGWYAYGMCERLILKN